MKEDPNETNAVMSGQLLLSWLPSGVLRRCVFIAVVAVAFYRVFFEAGKWYSFLCIFIAYVMSPKIVGEAAYFWEEFLVENEMHK